MKMIILFVFSVAFVEISSAQNKDSIGVQNNSLNYAPIHHDSIQKSSKEPPISDSLLSLNSTFDSLSIKDSLNSSNSIIPMSETDTTILSVWDYWLASGLQFVSFEERKYFQIALDSAYSALASDALSGTNLTSPQQQDYQNVNLALPIEFGIWYRISKNTQIGSSGLWFLHKMSAVLTDKEGRSRAYTYHLQNRVLRLSLKTKISPNIFTVDGVQNLSVGMSVAHILPGTEIYTENGVLEADWKSPNLGWNLFLGYDFNQISSFILGGEMGFSSLVVESQKKWTNILPKSSVPNGNAKWSLGGIFIRIHISLGQGSFTKFEPKIDESKTNPQETQNEPN